MDIHKPKPWHGAREFLKEYATIVIGVPTALAAEAIVENLHERRLSAEARESVRAELDLDLASLAQRDRYQPCIDARLAEIEAAVQGAEEGRPFPTMSYIGHPQRPAIYTQRWEAATSGGRTSLLSTNEQRDFARVYLRIERINDAAREEAVAWSRLRSLEGVRRPSAETLALARQALGEARSTDFGVRISIHNAAFYAGRIGIKGQAPTVSLNPKKDAICLPTSTRRQDVAALTGENINAAP